MDMFITFFDVFSSVGLDMTMFGSLLPEVLSILGCLFVISLPFIVVLRFLKFCFGRIN